MTAAYIYLQSARLNRRDIHLQVFLTADSIIEASFNPNNDCLIQCQICNLEIYDASNLKEIKWQRKRQANKSMYKGSINKMELRLKTDEL